MKIGQIKLSFQTEDHDGWYLCNGRNLLNYAEIKTTDGIFLGKEYVDTVGRKNLVDLNGRNACMVVSSSAKDYPLLQINKDSKTKIESNMMPTGVFRFYEQHEKFRTTLSNEKSLPLYTDIKETASNDPQPQIATSAYPRPDGVGGKYCIRIPTNEQEKRAGGVVVTVKKETEQKETDIFPTNTIHANVFIYLGVMEQVLS